MDNEKFVSLAEFAGYVPEGDGFRDKFSGKRYSRKEVKNIVRTTFHGGPEFVEVVCE